MIPKITVLLFSIFLASNGAGQNTFQKLFIDTISFGTQSTSILIDHNGFLIAAFGRTEQIGSLHYRAGIHLLKTDFNGNLLWLKKYAEPGKAITTGLSGSLQHTANGYFLCGSRYDTTTADSDFFLCKIDTGGEVEWLKPYGSSSRYETAFHGSKTLDGGYIMIGEKFIQGNITSSDYYLVRTDSLGNIIWQKTYAGINNDIGRKVHQLSNQNFIVSGTSESFGRGANDLWIFETDSAGMKKWEKTYGTINDDRLRFVSLASDGGFYVWGRLDTLVYNTDDPFAALVIKLDSAGNIVWRTFFNNKDELIISQLRELENGNVIAVGGKKMGQADSTAAWISKLNSSGDILWERQYFNDIFRGTSNDITASFNGDFQQTDDGGYVIAGALWKGTQRQPLTQFAHVWVVKLDSNGCFGPDSCGLSVGVKDIQSLQSQTTIVASPNPFNTQTCISVKGSSTTFANKEFQFQLFDVSGKLIQSHPHTFNEHGYCEFYLECKGYGAGMYFYSTSTAEAELGTGKLIVK